MFWVGVVFFRGVVVGVVREVRVGVRVLFGWELFEWLWLIVEVVLDFG